MWKKPYLEKDEIYYRLHSFWFYKLYCSRRTRECHIKIYLVLFLFIILVLCKWNAPLSFVEPLLNKYLHLFRPQCIRPLNRQFVQAVGDGQSREKDVFVFTFSSTISIQTLLLFIDNCLVFLILRWLLITYFIFILVNLDKRS